MIFKNLLCTFLDKVLKCHFFLYTDLISCIDTKSTYYFQQYDFLHILFQIFLCTQSQLPGIMAFSLLPFFDISILQTFSLVLSAHYNADQKWRQQTFLHCSQTERKKIHLYTIKRIILFFIDTHYLIDKILLISSFLKVLINMC